MWVRPSSRASPVDGLGGKVFQIAGPVPRNINSS